MIEYSKYTLHSSGTLNSRSTRREHHGLLIRKNNGHACIHPWPELGDPSLAQCLQDLKNPQTKNPLIAQALHCAELDSQARKKGISLFQNLTPPHSHATLPEIQSSTIEKAAANGFTAIKLKLGRNLKKESQQLRQLTTDFPTLKWRLDFNYTATPQQLLLLKNIPNIDFLEDPFPFDPAHWQAFSQKTTHPLALDRHSHLNDGTPAYLIAKPAKDNLKTLTQTLKKQKLIITSYLDHPLGQTYAAYQAAARSSQELCGLQTHHLYQKNPFSEQLSPHQPQFTPPPGTGLGFDELLKKNHWRTV